MTPPDKNLLARPDHVAITCINAPVERVTLVETGKPLPPPI